MGHECIESLRCHEDFWLFPANNGELFKDVRIGLSFKNTSLEKIGREVRIEARENLI